jgi:hypothetical protein
MAPPSGSTKREHPGDNSSGPSKRQAYQSYKLPFLSPPTSDEEDEEDKEDEDDMEDMEDRPYSEAQEAFPKHPAFDNALAALDSKFVRLTKQLQRTLAVHLFESKDLQNIKSRVSHAILP